MDYLRSPDIAIPALIAARSNVVMVGLSPHAAAKFTTAPAMFKNGSSFKFMFEFQLDPAGCDVV